LPRGLRGDPAVRVVIDTSLMTDIRTARKWTPSRSRRAPDWDAYRKLYLGWGVTIPAGVSPNVGVGGHVVGGGFGFLCCQHGLASDHLFGVEVVVVDETGTARSVVATREPSDPNRDLWWAHTGGGGATSGSSPGTGSGHRAPRVSIPLGCCPRHRTRC
jgi:FAD/FMN-containing dehydrogenase